eukprot:7433928-Pyramimonas_sp.AAC.1
MGTHVARAAHGDSRARGDPTHVQASPAGELGRQHRGGQERALTAPGPGAALQDSAHVLQQETAGETDALQNT